MATGKPLTRGIVLAGLTLAPLLGVSAAAERPNVVLCMVDDQGYGDVGYNGHPFAKTPVLDEMAASGLTFERFNAAAPVCTPTRGSVLTGRHPNRFGCFQWGHTLRPREVTIAEALRRAGYATGHFGKWHLGPVLASSPVSPGGSGFERWVSAANFYDNDPLLSRNGRIIRARGESSMVTVEHALKFIERAANDDEPFLAVVWFGNPHRPHQATDELRSLYPDKPDGVANYYGEITGIDRAMGRLRDRLEAMGERDNTLLWYTSDNGAEPPGSTGGLRGRKNQMWEGGLRVPSIIEWPARIEAARTTDLPAGTVDIYPTVLELLEVDVEDQPKPIDGVSLAPLIRGRAMAERPQPIGFWDHPAKGYPMHSDRLLARYREAQQRGETLSPDASPAPPDPGRIGDKHALDHRPGHAAWIDGDYKLHRIAGDNDQDARYKLYNLAADPKERNDLSDEQPRRLKRMKRQLRAWQRSVLRSYNGADYGGSRP